MTKFDKAVRNLQKEKFTVKKCLAPYNFYIYDSTEVIVGILTIITRGIPIIHIPTKDSERLREACKKYKITVGVNKPMKEIKDA